MCFCYQISDFNNVKCSGIERVKQDLRIFFQMKIMISIVCIVLIQYFVEKLAGYTAGTEHTIAINRGMGA